MVQKIRLMHYFLIGSSVGFTLLISGCCKENVDYSVKAKWIYINETEHIITYEPSPIWDEFNIYPKDTVVYIQEDEGPKYVEAKNFTPPINAKVLIDNELDTILTKKIHDVSEYEYQKLSERNYEFTFRYTERIINVTSK
ncbi:MAG: hypothetical protein MJ198_08425 [Bacteroidales bacterium]|nr:hypothetical protein [Bacteroidales bacterium]